MPGSPQWNLPSPIQATCLDHFILLDFITHCMDCIPCEIWKQPGGTWMCSGVLCWSLSAGNICHYSECEKQSTMQRHTGLKIRTLHVRDIRFPTSLGSHGTDAVVSLVMCGWSISCHVV
jgi:hypothetical protein